MSKGLTDIVSAFAAGGGEYDPYMHFEPFDLDVPDPDIFRMAKEDGVDLARDQSGKMAGEYPRLFQTGALKSVKKTAVVQAGSQSGKSAIAKVIIAASASRQPPICMRYAEGEDTGVRRAITKWNILRFGRRDSEYGDILDYNPAAKQDASWDCGNIVGVGKFPEELYCPKGGQIWIGSKPQALKVSWWPFFQGNGELPMPGEFLDTSKGNKGINAGRGIVHAINDVDIMLLSFEQEHTSFEAVRCHILIWDEEPKNEDLFASGQEHCEYQRFFFTPLKGITWSKDKIFGSLEGKSGSLQPEDMDYFHCTQFDSPYHIREEVLKQRRTYATWQRKSRVWGQYSTQSGQPFFNRDTLSKWRELYTHRFRTCKVLPSRDYFGVYGHGLGIPGIVDISMTLETCGDNGKDSWRIYEECRKGVGYMLVADSAEGGATPEQTGDWSFAMVVRRPLPEEVEMDGRPVIVATCRSHLPVVQFANMCMKTLRYYNNALLAPETGSGKDNEAFKNSLDEWPYWYYHTTGTQKIKKGYATTSTTRSKYFDYIQDWLETVGDDEDPMFKDSWIFDEMLEAIASQTPRTKKVTCDHPRNGSLDGVICLGIALSILKVDNRELECNDIPIEKQRSPFVQRIRAAQGMPQQAAAGAPRRIPMGYRGL